MWTLFWDMHSGGSLKEKQGHIYIEAGEEEAKIIFYNRFGHNPDRVSCTWKEYIADANVLVIYSKDIKPEERVGEVPEQGYVWVD